MHPASSAGTVSDTPRVLYIHVMKTGGTTLLQHLRKNIPPDELYPNAERDMSLDSSRPFTVRHLRLDYLRNLPEERRNRIRVYAAHFPYVATEALGGDLTTMTILRDPVDRTISMLRQWSRNRPEASLSLEEVYELPEVFDRLLHDHQTKIFSMTADDEPTGYMQMIDVDPARLALAKDNLATVDIVGLTEQYDDFLDLVVERFGWTVDRGVRANASPPENELAASDALRQRILEDNALDVELFEYATALVDARRRARQA
jgi:Sulfotransferase family